VTADQGGTAGQLAGRVIVITGGGRGLGAAYAKLAAAKGANVVINDLGLGLDGRPEPDSAAEVLAASIRAGGGQAVADGHDVSDFDGARALIERAVAEFGDLDVLINNAGILRDRMLTNMTVEEWDDVIRVHLRGHFSTTKHAADHWRARTKVSGRRDAVLINTTSIAGLHGTPGQFNYATAKAGIATMTWLAHLELHDRYGVRSYAIAPSGRTRMTLATPAAKDLVAPPTDGGFDFWAAENVAAVVGWLASADCRAPSGAVFGVEGDTLRRYDPWRIATTVHNHEQWTFEALDQRLPELVEGFSEAQSTSDMVVRLAEQHAATLNDGIPA
jgi:NAD(P)-dependent dehydrogenase (short-subunit alcohol dehydrogenase family)